MLWCQSWASQDSKQEGAEGAQPKGHPSQNERPAGGWGVSLWQGSAGPTHERYQPAFGTGPAQLSGQCGDDGSL